MSCETQAKNAGPISRSLGASGAPRPDPAVLAWIAAGDELGRRLTEQVLAGGGAVALAHLALYPDLVSRHGVS